MTLSADMPGAREDGCAPSCDASRIAYHTSHIGPMFDGIATRYDLMNRLISVGQDGHWRRIAVATLEPLPDGPLLDIGTGTGDLALEMRRQQPGRPVYGVDLAAGMIAVARHKLAARGAARITLAQGDVLRLPFPDGVFAGAATAFTLRNVPDLAAALAEIRRVLKPGAPFACLEIIRPSGPLAGPFSLYFRHAVPRLGALISRRASAYRYLPASVDRFITARELAAAMRAAGFDRVRTRRFWPGAVALCVGVKRET